MTNLECLAIIFSIDKFRPYLFGPKFIIESDHCALCFIPKVRNPSTRIYQWSALIQGYEYEVRYSSGKTHSDADCLSRLELPATTDDITKDYFDSLLDQPGAYSVNPCPIADVWEVQPGSFKPPDHKKPSEIPVLAAYFGPHNHDHTTITSSDPEAQAVQPERTDNTLESSERTDETFDEFSSGSDIYRNPLKQYDLNQFIDDTIPEDSIFGLTYQALLAGTDNTYITSNYQIGRGRLFKVKYVNQQPKCLLCVPRCAIQEVLQQCHDQMGHPGQQKTRRTVGNLFYWPGMVADIDEYVRTCSPCQLSKHSHAATVGKQVPLPISRGPFEDIAIDFVGPIRPVTERGNRYLVTIVCRLTKFAFAQPLKDIEAKTIVPVVQSYFMSYGIPKDSTLRQWYQFKKP